MLAKKKTLKASMKNAKKAKKKKQKSVKAASKTEKKVNKKPRKTTRKKKSKPKRKILIEKKQFVEELVSPVEFRNVQEPVCEEPVTPRVSPMVLAAQEAERKKREEQILIELRRKIITGGLVQPKPLPSGPRSQVQQPRIIKSVTKPLVKRFPFGRPEPVKPIQKPVMQVPVRPPFQRPLPQPKKAVQPISKRFFQKQVQKPVPFSPPAARPAVSGVVQPKPTGIPKRSFLKQKPIQSPKPVASSVMKKPAVNEDMLRRRILGRPEIGPSAKEIFEKRKPPEKPRGAGKAIYAVIAFLLVVVIGAGIIISLTLYGPGGPFGREPDENINFEQAMTEEMASALEESRFSDLPVTESNEIIPRGFILSGKKDEKFVSSTNVLSVSFIIEENENAEIESITGLTEGRITVVPSGEYSLQLRDSEGVVLYELLFNAVFVVMSNPPTGTEKLNFTYVVPSKKDGKTIAITHKGVLLTKKEI